MEEQKQPPGGQQESDDEYIGGPFSYQKGEQVINKSKTILSKRGRKPTPAQ